MITAKCINNNCSKFNIEYNFLGEPDRVECGLCGVDCELTDLRPDPTPIEPIEP